MAESESPGDVPVREGPNDAAPALGVPERGNVAEIPLPRLLLALYRARYTGALELTRAKTRKRILFQNGAPIHSESNLGSETLGVQLIDQGIITKDDHDRVSTYMQRKGCKEGVALLALELLDPKSLFTALKEQVRRRLLETFPWAEGEYALEASEGLDEEVQPFRSDPYVLVREGLLSHWGTDRLLTDLAPWMERYPTPASGFAEALRRLGNDEVDAVLSSIDGSTNLGVAIGSGFSSPQVLTTVWILTQARLIRFSDAARSDDTDDLGVFDFDAEIEIEVASPPGAGDAFAAAEARAANESRKAARSASPGDAATLKREVLERMEQLDELDYYQLLGVPSDATGGAIRKAYFMLAKRYHPDALTNLGLTGIREEAAAVFARIAEANEILKDPHKRREYDAALADDEPEIDTNALAQAETNYRKGEILVKMGDFRGALKFFAPAVELWPDESAYQAALGWALYKQPRPNAEAASFHLERAVELDPENPVPMFRLGVVLRTLGDSDRAAELMAHARILDPKVS